MPQLRLNSTFGVSQIPLSLESLRNTFLFGVVIKDSNGNELSDSAYNEFVEIAIANLETYLDIKIPLQTVEQKIDFISDDYIENGFIVAAYPLLQPISIKGFIGTFNHIQYPEDWISTKSINGELTSRNFFILPNYNSAVSYGYLSYPSNYRSWWQKNRTIPNYWRIKYLTGFTEIPKDLLNILYKMTAMSVLSLGGQVKTSGLAPGINSTSLSLDGLSQSVSGGGTAAGGPYSSLIKQYSAEIKNDLQYLTQKYSGIYMVVC
jgi:hypothetical protein